MGTIRRNITIDERLWIALGEYARTFQPEVSINWAVIHFISTGLRAATLRDSDMIPLSELPEDKGVST